MVGATSTLAGVMLVGFVVAAPAAAATGIPTGVGARDLAWLAVAGTGNVLGLLLEYRGLRIGKVGVVAAIASTEGALAAVIAIAFGEDVSFATAVLLAIIATGVVMASIAPDVPEQGGSGGSGSERERASGSRAEDGGGVATGAGAGSDRGVAAAAGFAVGAAVAFGVSLYATGRVGAVIPVPWVLVAARIVGVVAIALPAVATGRLRLTRPVLPLVVLSGLCELAGFAAFTIGARHGIAVAAVLASQFAAVAGVGAHLLFRERLARVQFAGVATIVVGVALLSGVRA
jgi:drug/metabolite transporter (DMT)-like permease